jgi:hypothetical protein
MPSPRRSGARQAATADCVGAVLLRAGPLDRSLDLAAAERAAVEHARRGEQELRGSAMRSAGWRRSDDHLRRPP